MDDKATSGYGPDLTKQEDTRELLNNIRLAMSNITLAQICLHCESIRMWKEAAQILYTANMQIETHVLKMKKKS